MQEVLAPRHCHECEYLSAQQPKYTSPTQRSPPRGRGVFFSSQLRCASSGWLTAACVKRGAQCARICDSAARTWGAGLAEPSVELVVRARGRSGHHEAGGGAQPHRRGLRTSAMLCMTATTRGFLCIRCGPVTVAGSARCCHDSGGPVHLARPRPYGSSGRRSLLRESCSLSSMAW